MPVLKKSLVYKAYELGSKIYPTIRVSDLGFFKSFYENNFTEPADGKKIRNLTENPTAQMGGGLV